VGGDGAPISYPPSLVSAHTSSPTCCPSFIVRCSYHPSSLWTSAPPSSPVSSGSQTGWWCCVCRCHIIPLSPDIGRCRCHPKLLLDVSTHDPPCEQWLTGLGAGATLLRVLDFGTVVRHCSHHTLRAVARRHGAGALSAVGVLGSWWKWLRKT
jgi:hypothetical protein